MDTESPQSGGNDGVLSVLAITIESLNLAKEVACITPAQAVFGLVSALLVMIRDSALNERDYVELGLSCADVCKALNRGLNGKRLDELSQFVLGAIGQLTATVAAIQKKVTKLGKRNAASRIIHAKSDKTMIATWKQDLIRVLQVFNTELAINTNIMVADMHRNALKNHGAPRPHPKASPKPPSSGLTPTNLDRAIELARQAIDEDFKQNYAEALRQYKYSLHHFSLALEYEKPDERSKRLIGSKVKEYLNRAEALEQHLAPREKPKKNVTGSGRAVASQKPSTDHLDRAIELVQRAIDQDLTQNYGDAHRQYLYSVEYFRLALKYEKSDKNKQLIRSKIKEYLARADTLKGYLERERSKKNGRGK